MTEIEAMVCQIGKEPVTTIEDLKLKAREVEWCLSEQDISSGSPSTLA